MKTSSAFSFTQEQPQPEAANQEAEAAKPTLRELHEKYKPIVLEAVTKNTRYRNACGHSDYENAMIECNGSPPDPPYCEGDVCRTPEELFDHLLVEYKSFVSIQLTKGRREENEADEEQVRRLCQKYLDRREEAMK